MEINVTKTIEKIEIDILSKRLNFMADGPVVVKSEELTDEKLQALLSIIEGE